MHKDKLRVLVFISGRGSNMENLIHQSQTFEVIGVISNNSEARGLDIAKSLGIKAFGIAKKSNLKSQKDEIYNQARSLNPDVIALAGFMQILEPTFVQEYSGKIINIHPSLLPKFPGLHTHKRAIEQNETMHGCSVHLVDDGVDTGPIIAQAAVTIDPNDSEESLTNKVLIREHQIYPWVLNLIGSGDIKFEIKTSTKNIYTSYSDLVYKEAAKLDFKIPPGR
jgi:formyltetrahydrofolate-dependent phosphoribosylglycinamide formyltransferase